MQRRAQLKRSNFLRRTSAMGRTARLMRRKMMARQGKGSRKWRNEWQKLKPEFERAGITKCERCGTDRDLTPAHSLKRRHIQTRDDLREVAILCVRCHEFYELQGEGKMNAAIREIIARRAERTLEAA